jgi:hypothetical protein
MRRGLARSASVRSAAGPASGAREGGSGPATTGDISIQAPPHIKLGPQADEIVELVSHYDSLVDARDRQILELTTQLESEQRR